MPDLDRATKVDEAEVGRVFCEEYGRSVAGLIRRNPAARPEHGRVVHSYCSANKTERGGIEP
ncbi:MAG TPA: hypothetical protein VM784_00880 [Actinomycetota bacterium]|nr:hypothetical protein [Actinomycetota bacterium]